MVNPSPPFPSELVFGSYLIYPSPAVTQAEKNAKSFILQLKRDRVTPEGRLIDLIIGRLAQEAQSTPLADFLDGTAALVPVPASGLQRKNSVWPARSLAEIMVSNGLASEVMPCLERVTAIRKSAFCAPGTRPSPREHYDTMGVKPNLVSPDSSNIILVDDVLTKGSTFSGAAARIREAYPDAQIRVFAIARTDNMTQWKDPRVGHITTGPNGAWVSRCDSA